ncbi:hypothetical protein [Roseateles chitinivorans]|uniref:hypothetical protein n=1 Tax=Roseateles chitinivorans TaxID=2917965 RepID=UPI00117DE650|nr:hypothetical protein [Roseateles chitinivorans]
MMKIVKVLIPLLFLVVEQSFSTGAAAAPATSLAAHKQLPEPVYTKRPASFAKNPLSIKFLAEQKRLRGASLRGRWPFNATAGVLSDNCELTPSADECGGTVESYSWEISYFDGISSSYDTAYVELEKVEVNGRRSCSSSVATSYGSSFEVCGVLIYADATFSGMNSIDFGGIVELIKTVKEWVTPEPPKKLVKCIFDPEVAAGHPGWNLTRDARDGYGYAELTFMRIYGGALPGIHNLERVDVKYPDGLVFTFNILWVGEQAVELFNPVLNEAIATGENTCV